MTSTLRRWAISDGKRCWTGCDRASACAWSRCCHSTTRRGCRRSSRRRVTTRHGSPRVTPTTPSSIGTTRSCRSPPTGRRAAGSRTSSTCPRTSAACAFYQEFLHPFEPAAFRPVHPSQREPGAFLSVGRPRIAGAVRRSAPRDRKHGMHISRALQIQARIGEPRRAWPPPNRRSMRCRCPSSCSARSVSCATRIARPIS